MAIKTAFAPVLTVPNGITDIDFYKNAFGATTNFCLTNDDGSIHVAELLIDGALFHVHEETQQSTMVSPAKYGASTVTIGLFVDDVQAMFNRAAAAGATVMTPVTDYEYGYRQGDLKDPFGHKWTIQCRIPVSSDWKP